MNTLLSAIFKNAVVNFCVRYHEAAFDAKNVQFEVKRSPKKRFSLSIHFQPTFFLLSQKTLF